MFCGSKKKSPLEPAAEDWQFECWRWLTDGLGQADDDAPPRLILPTDEFFAPTSMTGHARAEHVFRCVTQLAGLDDWPFDLVVQEDPIDPKVAPLAVVQNVASDPAGTFSVDPDERIVISYNPDLVDQPMDLIATFAHEISHGLVLCIGEPPPGGREFEEYAVDLTAAFLGFGIFSANTAFQFRQFSDVGSGSQGWSSQMIGYLTETEWAFAVAIFLTLHGMPKDDAIKWLKPGLGKSLSKSMDYLARHPERLATLRA